MFSENFFDTIFNLLLEQAPCFDIFILLQACMSSSPAGHVAIKYSNYGQGGMGLLHYAIRDPICNIFHSF
ncbi:hypothetical protein OIU77_008955 [Salix suchowensis]|uniref:Uncharacterized protein n=1 Tax=Salix suchowensis TaxID=1278906 RepID=A0ABQ9ADY8_9ROSI|nr:hypothetical protein OIU78_025086 [Salix suchowensis]KAJ6333002.1 hypothetical protein OIU77_008955 [Salix suchowensis]